MRKNKPLYKQVSIGGILLFTAVATMIVMALGSCLPDPGIDSSMPVAMLVMIVGMALGILMSD